MEECSPDGGKVQSNIVSAATVKLLRQRSDYCLETRLVGEKREARLMQEP